MPERQRRGRTAARDPLNSLWAGLAGPGVIWMALFFVIPFYAIAAVAFGRVDPITEAAAPVWNPRGWDLGAFHQEIGRAHV